MPGAYDGTIRIDTTVDTAGFVAGTKQITAASKGMAAGFTRSVGRMKTVLAGLTAAFVPMLGMAAIGGFAAMVKQSIDASTNYESSLIGLRSVVEGTGKSFSQAKEFLNEYTKDGLIPLTDAATAYKNLAARGYNTEQIEIAMMRLKDASAFGRQGTLSMGEAVRSATEGLKNENSILVDNAGVTKNVSVMWKEYAASIGKGVAELSKADKIQAEVNGLIKETQFQVGDAAKATGTYAGQVSVLGAAFGKLKRSIGEMVTPILTRIIPVITASINWLTALFTQVAGIMKALFGVTIASGAAQAAAAQDDLTDSIEQTGEAATAAGKAAKGALAPFDELNVLSQAEGTGGGSTEPETGLPEILPEDEGDGIADRFKIMADKIREFLEPAREPLERLGAAFRELGGHIQEGLEWAWNNILVPLGDWLSQEAAPVAITLLSAAIETLNEIIVALKPFGLWLWEKFLQPIAEWTGGAIIDILTWLTDKLVVLGDWIKEHPGLIEALAVAFLAVKAAIFLVTLGLGLYNIAAGAGAVISAAFGAAVAFLASPITLTIAAIAALIAIGVLLWKNWDTVKEKAGIAVDAIKGFFTDLWNNLRDNVVEPIKESFSKAWKDITEWAEKTWKDITDAWKGALAWFDQKVVTPIKNFFTTAWDSITGKVTGAWDAIKTAWNVAATWFDEKIIGPIKGYFETGWYAITTAASTAWETIKGAWAAAGTWFETTIWNPIKNAASGVWESVKMGAINIGVDIANAIVSAVNAVIGFINGMINGLAGAINGLINLVNRLPFINIPSITIPNIGLLPQIPKNPPSGVPLLASGAVIPPNAQFLAMLGDQKAGRNLEAPESLIRQIVREETAQNQNQEVTINFAGNMGALVRALKPYIDSESKRTGMSLVTGRGAL